MTNRTSCEFYRRHGAWSDPRGCADAFDGVGDAVSAVTSSVQGLLLHDYFGAHLYPEAPAGIAEASRATLPISERLPTLSGFDERPLTEARPPSGRAIGTCRDFALLTCSMLRHKRVAARVRCGFARYFHPPTYEDHWICEYWDEQERSWKMADAQLDHEHRQHLSITFDPDDMPKEAFLFPWQVWERSCDDLSALERFGHGDAKGFWFVRVNLARDFLALTKREVTAWDAWRDHCAEDKAVDDRAIAQCHELAAAGKLLDSAETFDSDGFDDLVASLRRPHWRG